MVSYTSTPATTDGDGATVEGVVVGGRSLGVTSATEVGEALCKAASGSTVSEISSTLVSKTTVVGAARVGEATPVTSATEVRDDESVSVQAVIKTTANVIVMPAAIILCAFP